MVDTEGTVAALSTPPGRGAIAVIRMTGTEAVAIAAKVFRPMRGISLSDAPHGQALYGEILHEGDRIDDGMATVFRGLRSYTGEDLVEISCHGGVLVTELLLAALFAAGARPAAGGDFTRRAFCNGKLRLSQAEAIMDIIDAESRAKLKLANTQSRGRLSAEIDALYNDILAIVTSAYAYIDYPDEDLTDIDVPEMQRRLMDLSARAEKLRDTYRTGKAIATGVKTVLCGKPNTGKSSLLNRLTGEETAIVTDIPGTTRDVVTEKVLLGDVMLLLSDTAGIRADAADTVEAIGVRRAMQKIEEAELLLCVFDLSRPAEEEDRALLKTISAAPCPKIALLNKCDLDAGTFPAEEFSACFDAAIPVSAKTGEGLDALRAAVEKLFLSGGIESGSALIVNARQHAEISAVCASLRAARLSLSMGMTQDVACLDLECALSALSELDGREVTEEIVHGIFSKFCVGK